MAERKSLTKKTRFEVFKRDSFRCQYCGKSAPDVVLNVDHIKPVSKGGTNDLTNLITSCFDCNQGKKHRLLDDKSVLEKQKRQLEELNERRLQLEMMMQWREGLLQIEEDKVEIVKQRFSDITNYSPNETGVQEIKKIVKKFDLNLVLDAVEISTNQYLELDTEGSYTSKSVEKAFNFIGRICSNKTKDKERPYLKDLYYIRGILKNRINYCDNKQALIYLERAYEKGASIESLRDLVLEVENWSQFKYSIEEFLDSYPSDDE